MPYYCAAKATWSGAWAVNPADALNASTPATAFQLFTWMNAGSLTDPSKHIIFMGEFGPFGLADTDEYADNTRAITSGIPEDTFNIYNNAAYGRNLQFGTLGNDADGTTPSSADGWVFEARGGSPYNFDMRGQTNNVERQKAAFIVTGRGVTITGFKVACGDWDPCATGRIVPTGSSSRVTDMSQENGGILLRGAWNSIVSNNTVEGGAYGGAGIEVLGRMNNSFPAWNTGATVLISGNYVNGCGRAGIRFSSIGGSTGTMLPYGATLTIEDNECAGLLWGSASVNSAILYGNIISTGNVRAISSRIIVRNNNVYGACQDAIVMAGSGQDCYGNYIHDINPGKTQGESVDCLKPLLSGTWSWTVQTNAIAGVGIKLGLAGLDGTGNGGWLVVGSAGGSFNVDELRNRCFRNRIVDVTSYGISTNDSSGMLIVANEIDNALRCNRALQLTASDELGSQWLAHNYVRTASAGRPIIMSGYEQVYCFNNIFDGGAGGQLGQITGTTSNLFGRNNVMRSDSVTYSSGASSAQNQLINNTVATPAYTVGVGPTAGGNCDAKGDINGLVGARTPAATARDLAGKRWGQSRLPIGPRQP